MVPSFPWDILGLVYIIIFKSLSRAKCIFHSLYKTNSYYRLKQSNIAKKQNKKTCHIFCYPSPLWCSYLSSHLNPTLLLEFTCSSQAMVHMSSHITSPQPISCQALSWWRQIKARFKNRKTRNSANQLLTLESLNR